jgi:amicyanin
MKNLGLWSIVAAVLVIIGAGALLLTHHSSDNGRVGVLDTTGAAATNQVTLTDFSFQPSVIKIKAGETVTWTNQDPAEHTVTADISSPETPDSPNLAKGQTYSFTFNKRGTYAYSCTFHPHMRGKVIVE